MNSISDSILFPRIATYASLVIAGLWVVSPVTTAQAAPGDSTHGTIARAREWPEADALFHMDTRWLGGDGAYSVELGNNRVLWLFGDSFVATSPGDIRWQSKLVRNTIAIQEGHDPTHARMTFHWRTSGGTPDAFFAGTDTSWYWPGHGVLVNGRLILFMMNLRKVEGGLGFEGFGWSAIVVDNPDDDPSTWEMRPAQVPSPILGVLIGSASVLKGEEYMYAFGAEEPAIHDVFLVRWHINDATRGDLREPEWWSPADGSWIPQSRLTRRPSPLLQEAATEFTVHYDSTARRFVQVQTVGFGAASLTIRTAPHLTGPWSTPAEIYTPPESRRPGVMVYSGKAHSWVQGADLVLTYCTNAFSLTDLVFDTSLYYPRFVRIDFANPKPGVLDQH
jgi:hypothetical protein